MIKRFLLSSFFGLCVISFGQVTYGGATYDNYHSISFTVSSDSGAVGVSTGTSGLQGNDRVNGNVAIGNNGDSISSSATLSSNNGAKIGMHAYAGKTVEHTNGEGIFYEGEENAAISIADANTASVSAYASKQNDKYTTSANGQLTSENGNGEILASSYGDVDGRSIAYFDLSNANTASESVSSSKQNDKYTISANGQLTSDEGGELSVNVDISTGTDSVHAEINKIDYINSTSFNINSSVQPGKASSTMETAVSFNKNASNGLLYDASSRIMTEAWSYDDNGIEHDTLLYIDDINNLNTLHVVNMNSTQNGQSTSSAQIEAFGDANEDNSFIMGSAYDSSANNYDAAIASENIKIHSLNSASINTYVNSFEQKARLNASGEAKSVDIKTNNTISHGSSYEACKFTAKANSEYDKQDSTSITSNGMNINNEQPVQNSDSNEDDLSGLLDQIED